MADAPPAGGGGSSGGGGTPADQAKGMLENPVMVLILGFVTCNLFSLYWMWVRTKELNASLGKQQVNPLFIFPGCLCFPLFWYGAWLYCQGFTELQKKKGEAKDETILHVILLILLAPVGQWMLQQKLNEMAKK